MVINCNTSSGYGNEQKALYILNKLENFFFVRIIFDALNATERYWVGFTDEGHEGNWQWTNGRSISTRETALWLHTQPNGKENQNCGFIRSVDLFMLDLECADLLYALCQKSIQ